jgi:capsid assembly protease
VENGTALRYQHVIETITSTPWEILEEALERLCRIVDSRNAGIRLTEKELSEFDASTSRREPFNRVNDQGGGAVAVLPLYGVIAPRVNLMTQYSGGTALSEWRSSFREALADPGIGAILIDVNSPGGNCALLAETAAEIRASRGDKPIWAIANTLCASAAYHLASQADRLLASPSALVGSIGVYGVHNNFKGALDLAGIERTFIFAGTFKVDGNDSNPLSETARSSMQAMIDEAYDMFVADIAAGRGVAEEAVRKGYGEGHVLAARAALKAGMVDGISSFEETVAALMQPTKPGRGAARASSTFIGGEALARIQAERVAAETALAAVLDPDPLGEIADSLRQTSDTLTRKETSDQ